MPERTAATAARSSGLTDRHIVVVDDAPALLVHVARGLRRGGYTNIATFADASEALAAMTVERPDLVLLDLHMPAVDGIAFLRELRRRCSPREFVPVLVLTGDLRSSATRDALRAGANDYATKPVDDDELLLRVKNLLSIRASYDALREHNAVLAAELRARAPETDAIDGHGAHAGETIRRVIERGGPDMVFQPVIELATGRVRGVEALARFGTEPRISPDRWFARAAAIGLGAHLELAAVRAAVRHIDALDPKWVLAVNFAASTLTAGGVREIFEGVDLGRIAIEITEHEPVTDYDALHDALRPLRDRGVRVVVDDAGAGYASFRHILRLRPDLMKLDISLTRGIDADPVKQALALALERFADDVGAVITAEGIETKDELDTLRSLGIHYGQGFYLARPLAVDAIRRFAVAQHDLSSSSS